MDGTRREWSFSLIDRLCKIPINKIRIGKKMANSFFFFVLLQTGSAYRFSCGIGWIFTAVGTKRIALLVESEKYPHAAMRAGRLWNK